MPVQSSPHRILLAASALAIVLGACDSGSSVQSPENGLEPPSPPAGAEVVWPLALTDAPDADSVSYPYGPRALPSRYDFHGGIDLPESPGTPVYSVLPGFETNG